MLVGRDAELRELEAVAAELGRSGCARTVLLAGEAGIGKTTLAAEFVARMRATGLRTAWAACRAEGGTPPYWPWAQLLSRLGRGGALTPSDADPEQARFLLFDSVSSALREAGPVLLVIDDLHWADPDSVRLLAALPAHLGDAPVLVLGTYRDSEPGGMATMAAERRIVLSGLTSAELGAAVRESTGETVDEHAARALHDRTGGNPFFAAEIVRMGRSDAADALPGGVRAVLERRLAALDPRSLAVLRAAAVLDAGTSAGTDAVLLGAVAQVAVAEVAEALAPAVTARLAVAHEGRHRFPHALVGETLRELTPAATALDLHRRAAYTLATRLEAGISDVAELAHHRNRVADLSGEPGDRAAAVAVAVRAATAATSAAAHDDAVRTLETALDRLGAEDLPGAPDRGVLLCRLGDALLAAGDPARSRAVFRAAAVHARRAGRPELLATAALGATGGAAGFEVDLVDPDGCVLLEEALATLPPEREGLRAEVSARLSVALAFTDGEPRRAALAGEAVAIARRLGDPRVLASALAAHCDAIAGPAHVAERRTAADEIVACARRSRDRTVELLGRRLRTLALAEAGRWAEVDREIEEYARVAEPLRQAGLSWCVPLWRGTRALAAGDEPARLRYDAELEAQAARSGSGNAQILLLTQRFVAALLRGRTDEVDLAGFLALAPDLGASGYVTHGLLRTLRGEPGGADLVRHWLDERGGGTQDSEWLPEVVQAAQVAILLADVDLAARVSALLTPFAGLFAVEGMVAGTWGSVDGFLGRLAALRGDRGAARAHLAAAAAADARAGAFFADRTRARATASGAPGPVADRADPAEFRRDGEVWTLVFAGRTARLRDSKGLRDLAVLLGRPGREVSAAELAGAPGPGASALPLADRTAVAAYRVRLRDLSDEADEAAAGHDPERAARAAAERDALLAELAAVTGLDGRPRTAGSDAERIRKAVGNRIRSAVDRVAAAHPELGRHLRAAVRTGTFCRYAPEHPVRWRL
ncbi:hypothetical protein GCM10009836_48790 [Pseudonocardia ailaonensis]|uniref:Orc1-like AAA ATPase domain-containing protein n=1 Tax=Pseudonocardia ailaonensis TaxID=367279 RepID=A0ABN2NDG0_9PSEU